MEFKAPDLNPFETWFDAVEREEIRQAGLRRYEVNRRKGHVSHHESIKGPLRDELGVAGERAASAFLQTHGIGYQAAPEVTENWEDITQDIVLARGDVGVKATSVKASWEEIWNHQSFLYPAKRELPGELGQDYPDHLLAVAVHLEADFAITWVVGAFEAFDVIAAPTRDINGKLAHLVPLEDIVELGAFLNTLRGKKEEGRPDQDRPTSPSQ